LEDSEDCRGAGGHGNQHVRLRRAQIVCPETICPALAAALLLRAAADVPFNSRHHFCFITTASRHHFEKSAKFSAPFASIGPVESADPVRRFPQAALPSHLPLKAVVAAGRLNPVLPPI
jgi:hypothetical protein